MTTPADLYRTCRHSARRLETLQDYDVSGDEDRMAAFLAGEPLPPPGPGKLADLELIASLRQRGVHVGRVHVITRPLSDYVRYELAVYAENAAAGEDVRIADGTAHPALGKLAQDFAVFDSETVILFDYDGNGRVRGYRIADDPVTVRRCVGQYVLAAAQSVSLARFTAAAAS
jgi:hypothetical protein